MENKVVLNSFETEIIIPLRRHYGKFSLVQFSVKLHTSMGDYIMSFKTGYLTDGISGTRVSHMILPRWKPRNDRYNACGCVHDALFGNMGFGVFTFEQSNQIFRGMLREVGYPRIIASGACAILGMFSKSHWGPDPLNKPGMVTLEKL